MNERSSWEVDSYQEGKWTISVRRNLENDRVDEGDHPDPALSAQVAEDVTDDSPSRNPNEPNS